MAPSNTKKRFTSKSSDRRLAGGKRPENYLHSIQNRKVNTEANENEKWDPKHYRLFVGNLGPDANDALLLSAFSKYSLMSKARVPIGKDGKNNGYGFVAFADSKDYLAAFKEMNGKFVGQRPIMLKRAESKIGKKK